MHEPLPTSAPRRFFLQRDTDVTGVSGEGRVADGVLWPDGTVSVRWRGEHPSTVSWDRGLDSVNHVHAHGGATQVIWLDEEPAPYEPEEIAHLPHTVRQLVHAADRMRDHWTGGRNEIWQGLHAACDDVWNRGDQP